jgi:hypothetical protein
MTDTSSQQPQQELHFQQFYDTWDRANVVATPALVSAIDALFITRAAGGSSGFERMAKCRRALEAIDRNGWERSFHQKEFHDTFIRACARVFWKTDKAGQFAKDHQRILQMNGWNHLCQEILISTPRRYYYCFCRAGSAVCSTPRCTAWRTRAFSCCTPLLLLLCGVRASSPPRPRSFFVVCEYYYCCGGSSVRLPRSLKPRCTISI